MYKDTKVYSLDRESSPAVLSASIPSSAGEKAKGKEAKTNLNSPSERLVFTGQHKLPGPCPHSALTSRLQASQPAPSKQLLSRAELTGGDGAPAGNSVRFLSQCLGECCCSKL